MERATYLHRANTNPTLHNFTRGNLRSSLSKPRKREGEKIETVTPFFPDHLVEASNGNRVTRCRGVSATAFPNFRNNGPCVRVRARVVVRIPTPSRSQRINANAQREREREKREERDDAAAESCAHPVRNANAKAKRELASSKRANNAVDAADGSTTCG